jgi:hypothetical protein
MKRLALSRAASGLIRALIARVGRDRDRILLTNVTSTDWRSLTFTGERHVLALRISGPGAKAIAEQLTAGLADAEFALSQYIVADIAAESITDDENGSVLVTIEALTICA